MGASISGERNTCATLTVLDIKGVVVKSAIDNPVTFFSGLGGLHDADVERLLWDPVVRVIRLEVDDLNANLVGLPGYPGREPCALVFAGVDLLDLRCDVQKDDCIRVYSLKATARDRSGYALALQLSPSGVVNLHFESVAVHEMAD